MSSFYITIIDRFTSNKTLICNETKKSHMNRLDGESDTLRSTSVHTYTTVYIVNFLGNPRMIYEYSSKYAVKFLGQ